MEVAISPQSAKRHVRRQQPVDGAPVSCRSVRSVITADGRSGSDQVGRIDDIVGIAANGILATRVPDTAGGRYA